VIPTRRLVLLASLPVGVAALYLVIPGALWALIALDLVIILVAGLDLVANIGAVQASRKVEELQAVGRPFDVELEVANTGRRSLAVTITDDTPGPGEGLPESFALAAGGRVLVKYRLRVNQRGTHPFGAVTLRFSSPLGLWQRQRRIDVASKVRVVPDFRQLRAQSLRAQLAENRMPVRARRRPGGENEFERLRPYVPGDPYKHIDWKATARRRSFTTREMGQEVNQNVIFLIDAGRMMGARSQGLSFFDHALNGALVMGQAALQRGDRVGILAFDSEVRAWLPLRGGARSGGSLIRGLYDVFPSEEEPDYAMAFRFLGQRVKQRSLVVLLTSVVDEANAELCEALVRALARRHLALAVWVRDTEVDDLLEAPPGPNALFQRGAAAELLGWRAQALGEIRRRGALVLDTAPEDLTSSLLGRYLEIKARRLL
jgi:uncharacterized protein (DUF58 family)